MRAYWKDSRAPRYSLLVALPLFVIYQVLVALQPSDAGGGLRNGADVILQSLFTQIAGRHGPLLFMVCLVGVGLWLVVRDLRAHDQDLRPGVLAMMVIESTLLALVFGAAVSAVTTQVVRHTASLMLSQVPAMSPGTELMMSLGAGLYEELLFRVLLVGTLVWVGKRLLALRPLVSGVTAALLGALAFAAIHYVGPYGDTLQLYSFVFRTIAGLAFSAMFLLRGFGITAWTHALYDAFLLMR